MRQVTADAILCVSDWDPSVPCQLTTLAVSGHEAGAAERAAVFALAGAAGHTSWLDLPAALRQRLVRACRGVPALGMYCLMDDVRAVTAGNDFLRGAIEETAEQFLSPLLGRRDLRVVLGSSSEELQGAVRSNFRIGDARPRFMEASSFPGLCELARLTAVVCRETQDRVDIPEDEDLLDMYDTYTVGSLSSGRQPW